MPIYEFQCRECGEKFERLCKISDKENEITCPKCGKKAAERQLSRFATVSSGSSDANCVPGPQAGSS